MLLLHSFKEQLEFLHLQNLLLDDLRLNLKCLLGLVSLLDLLLLLRDLLLLNPVQLRILLPPHLVRLQERAELDQVVLYQYVLLSQLRLPLLEVLLLLAELLLLVLERLLDLVHRATLLEQTGGRGDTVQLQVLGQLNFLVHFETIN